MKKELISDNQDIAGHYLNSGFSKRVLQLFIENDD